MKKGSFRHAANGIIHAVAKHPNIRIHLTVGIIALLLAWYLRLSKQEFIIIIFTINLVISSEMINTAIESMTDLITKEFRLEAKIAKDVSAGMVLIASFFAVVIGLVIYTPHLFSLLSK